MTTKNPLTGTANVTKTLAFFFSFLLEQGDAFLLENGDLFLGEGSSLLGTESVVWTNVT